MRFNQIKNVLFVCLLAFNAGSYALEVDVGRATIVLPGDNWQQVTAEKQEGSTTGAETRFDIVQKSWVLTDSAQKIKAVLRITGTAGGMGGDYGIRFTAGCQKNTNPNVYTNDYTGGSLSSIDCLRIFPKVSNINFLNNNFKLEKSFAESKSLNFPTNGTYVTNSVSMSSGTYLHAIIYIADDWKGIPSESISDLPAAIKPELAAWALEMAKAARSSVRSFSGKMVMPPIEFKN